MDPPRGGSIFYARKYTLISTAKQYQYESVYFMDTTWSFWLHLFAIIATYGYQHNMVTMVTPATMVAHGYHSYTWLPYPHSPAQLDNAR